MKLLPARFILDRARQAGRVQPGSIVVESSSGTFGLGLAMHCANAGYRLIIVSECIDPRLLLRFEDLGARVELVTEPAAEGGFQQARLDRLALLMSEHPGAYWPQQYENPHNPLAYGAFAAQLIETLGRVGALVGTVGSGGSVCGTTTYLRAALGDVTAVGVDTHGSVHFGQSARPRLLGGLGSSIPMPNVNHAIFDEVHWVSAAEAFTATRELHRKHLLFMGPTSGAAYMVARWWARAHPDKLTVAILPDEASRYVDTVYDNAWLRRQGVCLSSLPEEPVLAEHPSEAGDDWTYLRWGRRSLAQVVHGNGRGQCTATGP
jgi:cysteine synthase A